MARSFNYAVDGSEWIASAVWIKTPEREEQFLFSDPIGYTENAIFYLSSQNFDWNDVSDLFQYKIGVTVGYEYGEEIKEAIATGKILIEESINDLSCLQKLLGKRFDLAIVNLDVGLNLIRTNFYVDDFKQFKYHPKMLSKVPMHLLFYRNNKESTELMNKFNSGLKKLSESGEYNQIYASARRLLEVANSV